MSTPPNPNSIQHLEGIEHVRKRPGMYIGGTDDRALHHLIYETMNHAVEEALHGFCDHIWLTLRDDNEVIIRDNGPGLPMDYIELLDLHAMEVIMEQIGGIDRGQNGAYKITVGMMGVGLSAVNALSAKMRVENTHDGFLWQKTYRQGIPTSPLKRVSPIIPMGTVFVFKPDYTILQPNSFDYDRLAHRCRELAYQISGLHITIRDERATPPHEQTFYSTDGLKTLVAELNAVSTPFHNIIHLVQDVTIPLPDDRYETFGVEFAFQFTDGPQSHLLSYVNTVETTAGGTHLSALKASILSVVNDCDSHIRPNEVADEAELTWRDISPGFSAVISIRHPNPHFMSPTRVLLGNQEVYGPVAGLVFNAFYQHLKGMDFRAREKLMTHFFAKHIAPSADTEE